MTGAFSLVLWAVLAAPPPDDSGRAEEEVADPESVVAELSLRVPSGRFEGLSEAIGMRLPEARVVDHRDRSSETVPEVFAEIVSTDPAGTRARLTLVLRDGRAFVRELELPRGQWARVVATELSNLLYAIELEEVEADLTDISIPVGDAPVQTIRLVPHPAPPRARSRPDPEPELEGPEPPHEPGSETSPGWWLWPQAEGGLALGLPPPQYAGSFAGAGGSLGLAARHRGGGLLGFTTRLRYAGGTVSVVRVRVAARGGWVFDRPGLRVALTGQLFAEPFVVRFEGRGIQPLAEDGGDVPTLLLGGGANVWVAWRRELEGRPLAVALGPAVGLDLGFAPGAGAVGLAELQEDLDSVEVRRLGGLEFDLGLRLGIGFGVRSGPSD